MVRTRFAPSPTGYLHIGGVRTALFNWLFARQHGGQFLLRIDDTDQQRNVEAALAPILHGFQWLGIDWDEGPLPDLSGDKGPHAPYFQSKRSAKYQAAVDQLLASGHAYRDYATAEEVQKEREEAQAAKVSYVYSRKWMAETPEQRAAFESEGRQAVVRMKMPREGKLVLDDLIRGQVEFAWAAEQDHVIQRADGTCLYHLASVVDDQDMQITHVIRAEEHLSNTPRQVFIAQSLGYPLPQYAHLPYVAEPGSKNKLSKRKLSKYLKNADFEKLTTHGLLIAIGIQQEFKAFIEAKDISNVSQEDYKKIAAAFRRKLANEHPSDPRTKLLWNEAVNLFENPSLLNSFKRGTDVLQALGEKEVLATFNPVIVDFYEQVGYLPDAIINYLLLLGWSLDGSTEFFTREEMIRQFSLERVNKAPASFDPAKLLAFQDHYMQQLPIKQKVKMVLPYLQKAGLVSEPPPCTTGPKLTHILTAAGDRVKVAGDILDYADFFTPDDKLTYDEKAFDKRLRAPGAVDLLQKFRTALASAESFEPAALEALLHKFVEEQGIKPADLVHPLRVALTGKSVGFGLFDTLAILGRESSLQRIELAIAQTC